MKTLSIDASTKNTGIAIFDQGKLIHYECISSSSSDVYKRIKIMTDTIEKLYNTYKPTDIIMQDILPEDVKHNQSVFKALIYLQAAIVLMFHKYNINVELYTASHWRSLVNIKTGRGIKRESLKQASQRLIKGIYGIEVNDDISDAICLGMAYIKQHKSAF